MIHPPPLGNIRRAEHFLGFMRRFIAHLADVMRAQHVTSEGPASFLAKVQEAVRVDAKTLRWGGRRAPGCLRVLGLCMSCVCAGVCLLQSICLIVYNQERNA